MSESRRVEFAGSQGVPVGAQLEVPDCEPRAYALFAHAFADGSGAASRLCHALSLHGIAVLCLDITGLPSGANAVDELVLAAEYLRAEHGAPTLLVGHDLGGAAVLAATPRIPGTRAVATIGAPAGELAENENLAHLGAALLVLHSPVDQVVGVDNARVIFDAARHPKSFLALDGADHLLSEPADVEFAASVLATWAARYLPAPAAEAAPEPALAEPAAEDGVVTVTDQSPDGLAQLVTAGRHTFTADEPVPIGGDTGPNPYDLLLAALGACTSMTLRLYASRKSWPLEKVTISLRHTRIHARDCAECETTGGMVSHIDRVIRLDGPLDDDQRQRLLEIADKCPVHRTLTSEIAIRTVAAA